MTLYLVNQLLGIVFIFYGLFLVKKENASYQARVLSKNREIEEKAALLKTQTTELSDLNSVKNKLFSVIAHDLKTPMYALRNLFRSIQQQNLPAKEIKSMLPDVIDDLNYTTGLMENLLHWAKSQMQSEAIKVHMIDLHDMVREVIQLLQLQADAKDITIQSKMESPVFALADRDMINLVIRNLLSNAIKFTPNGGQVSIDANEMSSYIEVYIKDSGRGISQEALQKINQNNYFTTNGTAQEPGTGLGLMLCKEFLVKNGGQLCIESEPGAGSIFSFTLPRPE
jgi:signal transduction histidine kinase